MKIFLSFLQGYEHYPVPAYSFWPYYIKKGIEEAGYEWDECPDIDWARGLQFLPAPQLAAWKDEAWQRTIDHVKKNRPDLFLSYLYPQQIDVNAIREFKRMGIPTVNFYCDNYREFSKIPAGFGAFDLNWVPEFESLKDYETAGIRHIHLPMPMWVEHSYRNVNVAECDQITFIGSADQQRIALFNEAAAKRIDHLQIYGRGWLKEPETTRLPVSSLFNKGLNQFHFLYKNGLKSYYQKIVQGKMSTLVSEQLSISGSLSFEEYMSTSRNSMVTLGVNRFPSFRFPFKQPGTYSRLRDIEAPMLGACYLTEWTEGIGQFYNINKEILTYKNAEEMAEQVNRLRHDAELRKSLRRAGQNKALSELSIPNSLQKIVCRLKIP